MKENIVEKVNQVVYGKYPHLSGKKPKVNSQPGENSILIYISDKQLADGNKIKEIIRVTCNSNGDILKISSSRG